MKPKKVMLQESIHVVMSTISNDGSLGDDEAIDMILGEVRECLESNGVKLPHYALHDLWYNSEYYYEEG